MEESTRIEKVTISGPTLTLLLNHLATSSGPTSGLILGDMTLHTPTSLTDDDDSPVPPSLFATVSGFTPSPSPSPSASPSPPSIGFFSSRPLSPLRPSLLDHLNHSPPSPRMYIFLLLTTSHPNPIHTFSYRAFQFHPFSHSFTPLPIEIINLGPGFGGQYGGFNPKSGLPWLPCLGGKLGSPMKEDGGRRSLGEMKRVGNDQKVLDGYVGEGYKVEGLGRLLGGEAVGYMGGVEELYETMLGKLKGLTKLVEASSDKILQLENHNMKLRRRVAGIE